MMQVSGVDVLSRSGRSSRTHTTGTTHRTAVVAVVAVIPVRPVRPVQPSTCNHVLKEELPPSLDSSSPVNSHSLALSTANLVHNPRLILLPREQVTRFTTQRVACYPRLSNLVLEDPALLSNYSLDSRSPNSPTSRPVPCHRAP